MLLRRAALVAALALSAAVASAQEPPPEAPPPEAPPPVGPALGPGGTGFVEARLGLYHNDDSRRANPFLDEAETVVEPVIVFSWNVTDRVGVDVTGSYDYVSSASIERLSRYPGQSGASRDNYFGGDVGLRLGVLDHVRLGLTAGLSSEYDYQSRRAGLDVAIDLFQKATTLRLSVIGFDDTVRIIRFDGREDEGDEPRRTVTATAGWYQALSATVHFDLGYSLTAQDGFLGTAYNGVVLEDPADPPNPLLEGTPRGVEVAERVPSSRVRHTLFGDVRWSLDELMAVGAGARLYADTWGVEAVTLELRFMRWLVKDVLRTRLRYRAHVQSAADFFEDRWRVAQPVRPLFLATQRRTQDADLGGFHSHTLGVALAWSYVPSQTLELSFDYVLRSDGLDQVLLAVGWRWSF